VAPDDREKEGRAQLQRPDFQQMSNFPVRYLPSVSWRKIANRLLVSVKD